MMPKSKPLGRVDIAIDFEKEIYNFKGFKVEGDTIYKAKKYSIYSNSEAIKECLFKAKHIIVAVPGSKEELLEIYAYKWITSSERKISDFNSKDFLDQLCITHSILRVQSSNHELESNNDIYKKFKKEDALVQSAILKLLETNIKKTSAYFSSRNQVLDSLDVYAKTYEITSLLFGGENKKHVEQTLEFLVKNPEKKLLVKQMFRDHSVHTVKKNKNNKNTHDLKTIEKLFRESISSSIGKISIPQIDYILRSMIEPNHLATHVTKALNHNSSKIFKPSFENNLNDHIFGSKGKHSFILSLLKDNFKSTVNQSHSRHESYESYDLENIEDTHNNSDYALPKRWGKHAKIHNSLTIEDALIKTKKHLGEKQFEVYKKWLLGTYVSNYQNDRTALSRARTNIIKYKLQVPIP